MPRLSKLIEKIEDRLANKWGCWYERNKARVPLYAVLGGIGWYLYGMFLNSLKLGKESVFNTTGEVIESIWVFNPFKNLFAVFTPFGLGVSAFIALMVCLITKKGYSWFSGYKFTRDARGFDILPDGTHGTSGFATKKELAEHLELGSAEEVTGMLLGRIKARPDDPEKNATLPQSRVRAKLRRLDGMILREAESKLRANQERNVKNSTAYTMAVLFNCIAESESDLMIDPYLNAICAAV